jgi:hypothetical protein
VGIDDGDAVAGGDILGQHVPHERTFSGPRAPKQREVTTPRGGYDVYRPAMMKSVFTTADEYGIKVHDPRIIKWDRRLVEQNLGIGKCF